MARPGRWLVQLRFATGLTSEDYVRKQAWRSARLSCCPMHPEGGCGFRRHGTYRRVHPDGTLVARFYCPQAHMTFSLLPDCLAAGMSSTLQEVEDVVAWAEDHGVNSAADHFRPAAWLDSGRRWVLRRVHAVAVVMLVVRGLLPDVLAGTGPTLAEARARLGGDSVLVAIRAAVEKQLGGLRGPVGFRPPPWSGKPP